MESQAASACVKARQEARTWVIVKERMSTVDHSAALVVPCYNEAQRLDGKAFVAMVEQTPGLRLVFVDDGSRDDTAAVHERLRADHPEHIECLRLPTNRGKGEAVRQGLLHALAGPAAVVGYVDADLSTPCSEILRLLSLFEAQTHIEVLIASRVMLLGRTIQRFATRHYTGRVFATAASLILQMPVYDTQCGAKLLRRSPTLSHALATPFRGRWTFDVELLGRLVIGGPGITPVALDRIYEEPLFVWRDEGDSRLTIAQMLKSGVDLALAGWDLASRRRAR